MSQPRHGFRAGLDSVLLGAAVSSGRKHLLDIGAGVGTAALVALAFGRAAQATLVERHDETALLARQNIADNAFSARATVIGLDILDSAEARRAAGLGENAYDAVIANPPFFGAGQGTLAPEPSRAGARHMGEDQLDLWVRRAAGCASAGGELIVVYPAVGLADLLAAMNGRFGALTILPILPRADQKASRILVRGVKGSRAPLTLLPSRALHGASGREFEPQFDAIFRGIVALDW